MENKVMLTNIASLRGQLGNYQDALKSFGHPEGSFPVGKGLEGIATFLEMLTLCRLIIRDGNEALLDPEVLEVLGKENCELGEVLSLFRKKLEL